MKKVLVIALVVSLLLNVFFVYMFRPYIVKTDYGVTITSKAYDDGVGHGYVLHKELNP